MEGIRPRGSAELRREVAGPVAVSVVAESLGLVGADVEAVPSWYDAIVSAISDITPGCRRTRTVPGSRLRCALPSRSGSSRPRRP
ncbi:hypothetical protein BIV24_08400 [Streptomyces colonosanans]|uniref:Uncharacterized protein n=1 Tax=Streptomyces colonosanans TaxID=1428652 RepID=A0A1S2PP75_9ACTN|nr:hypothetical protein BIV24_08400 [Streptomyces colonosanans]